MAIVLVIHGEEEARKFITYLLLNYKEPIMAYRGTGNGGSQGLLILMAVGHDIMLVSINDEPAECRDSDYYALFEFTKLTCGRGMPGKDTFINGSVMFILKGYDLYIDLADEVERVRSRGAGSKPAS
jgi:hypothetical protein